MLTFSKKNLNLFLHEEKIIRKICIFQTKPESVPKDDKVTMSYEKAPETASGESDEREEDEDEEEEERITPPTLTGDSFLVGR